MTKYISIAIIAAFILSGCNSSSTNNTRPAQPAPVQPAPVQPPSDEEGPTQVTGSIRSHMNENGGYVTITANWRTNGNIDPDSLIISHAENGQYRDEVQPSVFSNGSVSKISEDIYIYPNDTDDVMIHTFRLTYYTVDNVGRSQTWVIEQPAQGDDNETSAIPMVIF